MSGKPKTDNKDITITDDDLDSLEAFFLNRFGFEGAPKAMLCCLVFARNACPNEASFIRNAVSVAESFFLKCAPTDRDTPRDSIRRDQQVVEELLR